MLLAASCVCGLLTVLFLPQAVVLGIERSSLEALELIVQLLSHLYQAGIVTKDQMQQVGGGGGRRSRCAGGVS